MVKHRQGGDRGEVSRDHPWKKNFGKIKKKIKPKDIKDYYDFKIDGYKSSLNMY